MQLIVQAAEAKLLAQMEAIKAQAQARDKNEKRHKHEAKMKARVRAAQMVLGEPLLMTLVNVLWSTEPSAAWEQQLVRLRCPSMNSAQRCIATLLIAPMQAHRATRV